MLADNEIALHQCRLTIWHACWMMDNGAKGRHESSMAKSFVSEELFKVTDRCVQVLGGIGISDETPVEMIFRDMRLPSVRRSTECTSTPSDARCFGLRAPRAGCRSRVTSFSHADLGADARPQPQVGGG